MADFETELLTEEDYEDLRVGSIVRSHWGNECKRFNDGWCVRSGSNWDRWTVLSDKEMARNHPYVMIVED